jgi:hypothetical protein
VTGAAGSGTGLIHRALVDDLTVIHPQLACSQRLAARYSGDVELLEAMQVGERKGKALPFVGVDQLIDVDGMNRLVARLIATTVAQGFPASGQAGEKEVCHGFDSFTPRRCRAPSRGGAWR